jgi:hypothetical protein
MTPLATVLTELSAVRPDIVARVEAVARQAV